VLSPQPSGVGEDALYVPPHEVELESGGEDADSGFGKI
jgi:hypothetical protein